MQVHFFLNNSISTDIIMHIFVYVYSLPPVEGKIRLLDVGSCYNPFLAFPELQAIGIDISPATDVSSHN